MVRARLAIPDAEGGPAAARAVLAWKRQGRAIALNR
jgi:hypothetical protein